MDSWNMGQFLRSVNGRTIAQKLFKFGCRAVPAWEGEDARLRMSRKSVAATSDPVTLESDCSRRRSPGAIALLSPGVVVVDLDVKNGVDGVSWWRRKFGRLPDRSLVRTPRGGAHIWVWTGTRRRVSSRVDAWGRGVDILGTQSNVPMPGSRTRNGAYAPPDRFTLLRAPRGLLELLPWQTEEEEALRQPTAVTSRWGITAMAAFTREIRSARYPSEALNRLAYLAGRRCDQIAPTSLDSLVTSAILAGMRPSEAETVARRGYAAGRKSSAG